MPIVRRGLPYFPELVGPLPKKNPTAYLKDGELFFDTIVFTLKARYLIAETGPGQIMIGTDYPFPDQHRGRPCPEHAI